MFFVGERCIGNDKNMTTRTIYALSDPRDGQVRYVGVTANLRRRTYQHTSVPADGDFSHKSNWIRALQQDELQPCVTVLEKVDSDLWKDAERHWISHFRGIGCDLTNATDGGDGVRGWKPTGIDLERLRRNGSIPKPSGFGAKVSAAMKGRVPIAAIKARAEKCARGELKLTEEHKARVGEAMRNLPRKKCDYCDRMLQARSLKQHMQWKHPEVLELEGVAQMTTKESEETKGA